MILDGLDHLSVTGAVLLGTSEPVNAHNDFMQWRDEVSRWLTINFLESGLVAQWAALGASNLVVGSTHKDDPLSWHLYKATVQSHLRWLGNLPSKVAFQNLLTPARAQNEAKQTGRKEIKLQTAARAYVDPDRINALKALPSGQFDLSKLIRMCEELNICFAGECYIGMIMHTRAIIDHVPPIFNCKNFGEVANNYSVARSFKEAMATLETSSRKIADLYLHVQIRNSEALPNTTQVDFSNTLDLLLAEIWRILKP